MTDQVANADLDERIERVASLGEPVRRALYRYVAAQPEPVTREQAAAALGLAVHVVKFHLDRLVASGLLEAQYRRPEGRGGPGAGRPAKVYRATGDIELTVPERRYDIAGRLLVRAIARATRTGAPTRDALTDAAYEEGRVLAAGARPVARTSATAHAVAVLSSCGFDPNVAKRDITLHNCPFHHLAEEDRELICTMNLALVRGILDASGASSAQASLDPIVDGCCVRIAAVRAT